MPALRSDLNVYPGGARATQTPYGTSAYGGGGGGYGGWLDQMFRMKMMMAQEQLRQMQYGGQLQHWQAQMGQQQAARDAAQQKYAMQMGQFDATQQARAMQEQQRMQKQAQRPYLDPSRTNAYDMANALGQFQRFGTVGATPGGTQQMANYLRVITPERAHEGMMSFGRNMAAMLSGGGSTPAQAGLIGQAMRQGQNPFGATGGAYAPGGMGAYRFAPSQRPSQKKGTLPGTVPKTGPYQLHKGEVVVPKPQVDAGLVAALVGDARRKGVPLGQAMERGSLGCGTLGRYQIGSLGQPGAGAADLFKFQQMRQGAMPPTQMGLPMAGGQAPSAWPGAIAGMAQQPGPGAPFPSAQMELPFARAASELDSLAVKEPMHASFIRKAKGFLAKGKWGEFDNLVRRMSKGRARVIGGSLAAIGAGVMAYNLKRNAEEPGVPKTPEAKSQDPLDWGHMTGIQTFEDDPRAEAPSIGGWLSAAGQARDWEEMQQIYETERAAQKEAEPPAGGPPADMGTPPPAAAPPPQAQFGLQQALEQVGAAPEGEPYEGIFGKGTRPQRAPSGTIELTGQLSEREKAFRELEGMPQQRDSRHTAAMARASATNIYTTLMNESNRLSPEAYKNLKDEADRQMNLSMKFEGIAKSREKAMEDELKAGADLSAAIAKIGATQAEMTKRQLTVEEAKAMNQKELTKLRESAETLQRLRMSAVEGTRRERMLAQDSIADILLEVARITGRGDVTGEEIDRVAAELIQLPDEEFDATMDSIRARLNEIAGVR